MSATQSLTLANITYVRISAAHHGRQALCIANNPEDGDNRLLRVYFHPAGAQTHHKTINNTNLIFFHIFILS